MSKHTYNNKNTPGGRRVIKEIRPNVFKQVDYKEERRQSISQLRVAERLTEEQQAVETGIIDESPTVEYDALKMHKDIDPETGEPYVR